MCYKETMKNRNKEERKIELFKKKLEDKDVRKYKG